MGGGWLFLLSAVLCGSLFVGRIDGVEGCQHFVRMPMAFMAPYKDAEWQSTGLSKSTRMKNQRQSNVFTKLIPIACFSEKAWEGRRETVPLLQKALGLVGRMPPPKGQEKMPSNVGKLLTSEITGAELEVDFASKKLQIEICIKDDFFELISRAFKQLDKRIVKAKMPKILPKTGQYCFSYEPETSMRLLRLTLDERLLNYLNGLLMRPPTSHHASTSNTKIRHAISDVNDALNHKLFGLPVKLVPRNCEYDDLKEDIAQLYQEAPTKKKDKGLFQGTNALLSIPVTVKGKKRKFFIANIDPLKKVDEQEKIVDAITKVYNTEREELGRTAVYSSFLGNGWDVCFRNFDDTIAKFVTSIHKRGITLGRSTFTKDYCVTISDSESPPAEKPQLILGDLVREQG